jgi:hypothetical protein
VIINTTFIVTHASRVVSWVSYDLAGITFNNTVWKISVFTLGESLNPNKILRH